MTIELTITRLYFYCRIGSRELMLSKQHGLTIDWLATHIPPVVYAPGLTREVF